MSSIKSDLLSEANMERMEIQLSKTKLILTFLGASLFVILGIFLAKNPENFISFRHHNVLVIRFVGILAISFFGLVVLTVPRKLFDKKPGLVIDENGITDNSSMKGNGFIPWKNITSVKQIKIKSTSLLLISVSNPKKYFETSNFFIRYFKNLSLKTYGTPIAISSNSLKCNFSELEKLISERLKIYKTANKLLKESNKK